MDRPYVKIVIRRRDIEIEVDLPLRYYVVYGSKALEFGKDGDEFVFIHFGDPYRLLEFLQRAYQYVIHETGDALYFNTPLPVEWKLGLFLQREENWLKLRQSYGDT